MDRHFTFDIDAEWCCEMCNETYDNYFNCPMCGIYASTCVYGHWDKEFDKTIKCENCEAEFEFIEGEPYFGAKWLYI